MSSAFEIYLQRDPSIDEDLKWLKRFQAVNSKLDYKLGIIAEYFLIRPISFRGMTPLEIFNLSRVSGLWDLEPEKYHYKTMNMIL